MCLYTKENINYDATINVVQHDFNQIQVLKRFFGFTVSFIVVFYYNQFVIKKEDN